MPLDRSAEHSFKTPPSLNNYKMGCKCEDCWFEYRLYLREYRGKPNNRIEILRYKFIADLIEEYNFDLDDDRVEFTQSILPRLTAGELDDYVRAEYAE